MSRIAAALLLLVPLAAVALEDPMRPPAVVTPSRRVATVEEGYVLTSTYIARERRAAVINGKSVTVGEQVGGARVLEILPTQVRLQVADRDLVVRLLPVSVKTPAKTEEREQQ